MARKLFEMFGVPGNLDEMPRNKGDIGLASRRLIDWAGQQDQPFTAKQAFMKFLEFGGQATQYAEYRRLMAAGQDKDAKMVLGRADISFRSTLRKLVADGYLEQVSQGSHLTGAAGLFQAPGAETKGRATPLGQKQQSSAFKGNLSGRHGRAGHNDTVPRNQPLSKGVPWKDDERYGRDEDPAQKHAEIIRRLKAAGMDIDDDVVAALMKKPGAVGGPLKAATQAAVHDDDDEETAELRAMGFRPEGEPEHEQEPEELSDDDLEELPDDDDEEDSDEHDFMPQAGGDRPGEEDAAESLDVISGQIPPDDDLWLAIAGADSPADAHKILMADRRIRSGAAGSTNPRYRMAREVADFILRQRGKM